MKRKPFNKYKEDLAPEKGVVLGKNPEDDYLCQIKVKKNATNDEVYLKLQRYMSFLINEKGNVHVTIKPKLGTIFLTGLNDYPEMGEEYPLSKEITLESYDKFLEDVEDIGEADEREKNIVKATVSASQMVLMNWSRLGLTICGVKFNNDSYSLGILNGEKSIFKQLYDSVQRYDGLYPQGIFWEREWVQNKDLDTKTGGGKYDND